MNIQQVKGDNQFITVPAATGSWDMQSTLKDRRPEGEMARMTKQMAGKKKQFSSPDEYRCVEQAYDWSDIDAHQHPAVNILQAQTAIFHLSVGFIIVQNQLHLQQTCETQIKFKKKQIKLH